ncbi:hypothetical protein [Streptomyces misionensis]
MTVADDLTRRFITRQLQLATDELVRDAERLAVSARAFADDAAAGRSHGNAYRLAQDAALLAHLERRLAGMREIAGLLEADTPPS